MKPAASSVTFNFTRLLRRYRWETEVQNSQVISNGGNFVCAVYIPHFRVENMKSEVDAVNIILAIIHNTARSLVFVSTVEPKLREAVQLRVPCNKSMMRKTHTMDACHVPTAFHKGR